MIIIETIYHNVSSVGDVMKRSGDMIRDQSMMMMIDVLWEVKNETPFRYTHAEIRTQVLVICGPMRYQLDHGGDQSMNDTV